MTDFPFDRLRRWPDIEAANLFAYDATDKLLLETAADALRTAAPGDTVVVGDRYGALTLGALHQNVSGIRTHQDDLSGERALDASAASLSITDAVTHAPLDASLFRDARVVLMQLPRSLEALAETAELIARHAAPGVAVFAGGRIKHMSRAMNDVLARYFGSVTASLAQQKSRVLVARDPRPPVGELAWPAREFHADLGLTVCAHGAAFAGTKIDIGTRFLLEFLDRLPDVPRAIDLGCGTGVLATLAARARPAMQVIASDSSAAAVASAQQTALANDVADRVTVVRDDGLLSQPDGSSNLILLNPPFHVGATVHAGIAQKLFDDAARVLRPGGELWTVWNSHLGYRPALERTVGATRQLGRNAKFTVTVSTKR
ncbi:16S rRNA (guanine1207-N2)-methyltransferase [Okibacterium sp. HSC-33S16]|uniref:class I SAM-dependent methyltransferase n=1 Tax=Okibacterium sp. HSC-33S16 TaxID=2910965 RepID=UPI00209F8773|nr:methyltransferase [Okibacterium sp. HSC-33S16]MCP2031343.1 16S rRNA (guanine1207-N2)-methyltransferase [Okibacterium sp. HSC-33S16]